MKLTETPARIEPCGIEENIPEALVDLVLELQGEANALGAGLHPDSAAELRSMTRMMNAYYSNLIEGHNTKPADIEAALEGRIDDAENRPLATVDLPLGPALRRCCDRPSQQVRAETRLG